MAFNEIPIITIDGPGGTGKGTLSRLVAEALGFHFLDSGALYRLLGVAARRCGVSIDDAAALAALAPGLSIRFVPGQGDAKILLDNEDVTPDVRSEQAGGDASRMATFPAVREALLDRQREFCEPPGLVADGRDMGTVVFPGAALKIFLTASREERARRRHKQLREKGIDVTLDRLLEDLAARDARDSQRAVAPMMPASDAQIIDTTCLSIDDVLARVLELWQAVSKQPS